MKYSSVDIFSDVSTLREAFQEAFRVNRDFRSTESRLKDTLKLLRKPASAFMDAVYKHYDLLEYK